MYLSFAYSLPSTDDLQLEVLASAKPSAATDTQLKLDQSTEPALDII
jgi:hypothetical protein